MKTSFSNLKITGIASALPAQSNKLYELMGKFDEQKVKRIIQGTGINSVHVATEEMKTSDLGVAAANLLLKQLNIDPKTIDAIVYITRTPDRVAPPNSAILQSKLGLNSDAVAFDINHGCSGYMYGLYQAALLVSSNSCSRVLVCTGDVITKLVHPDDLNLRMLFGDAGTATIVEKGNDVWDMEIYTDGSGADYLTAGQLFPSTKLPKEDRSHYYYMDGKAIIDFVLSPVVSAAIQGVYTKKNWAKNEFTLFLHQANSFIVNLLRLKIGLETDKVPVAVETVGNTGSSSIPLLLSMIGNEYKNANKLKKSLLSGFGVGLSWGAIGLDLSQTDFFGPVVVS